MNNAPSAQTASDRDRVLEAADRLFYGRGIQAVGMDAVRTESGVSLKRLYASFPSKEALVIEVLRRRSQTWDAGIAEATAKLTAPRDKLLAVYDFLGDWFREDDFRGCGFINAYGELGAVSPEVAAAARTQKRSFQEHLAALTSELGAPPALAAQLALLAEGAQTTAAIDGSADAAADARAAAELLIDVTMSGVHAPSARPNQLERPSAA